MALHTSLATLETLSNSLGLLASAAFPLWFRKVLVLYPSCKLTMASRRPGMKDLMLDALEDLGEEEFKKFKFKLRTTAAPGDKNIPLGRLEKADQQLLVELLVEFYENKAPAIMVVVLEDIGLKKNASKLTKGMNLFLCGPNVLYCSLLFSDSDNLFGRQIT